MRYYVNEGSSVYSPVVSQCDEETHWFHSDALGSTVGLTDASGGQTDTFLYEAFGASLSRSGSTITPCMFAANQGNYPEIGYSLSVSLFGWQDPSNGLLLGDILSVGNAFPTSVQEAIGGIGRALVGAGRLYVQWKERHPTAKACVDCACTGMPGLVLSGLTACGCGANNVLEALVTGQPLAAPLLSAVLGCAAGSLAKELCAAAALAPPAYAVCVVGLTELISIISFAIGQVPAPRAGGTPAGAGTGWDACCRCGNDIVKWMAFGGDMP
jgi:hypothetical protein